MTSHELLDKMVSEIKVALYAEYLNVVRMAHENYGHFIRYEVTLVEIKNDTVKSVMDVYYKMNKIYEFSDGVSSVVQPSNLSSVEVLFDKNGDMLPAKSIQYVMGMYMESENELLATIFQLLSPNITKAERRKIKIRNI